MNAALLLEHFARVTDSADAIAQLRRFVLDLAVRGKLVEQDAGDEAATDPLRAAKVRDFAEHSELVGWAQAPLGRLLQFQYGKGLHANERQENGAVPVFGSNGIVAYTHTALTEKPSIIVGRKGSAGALNLCLSPSWTTDVAYFVEAPAYFSIQYLLVALSALDLYQLGKGVKPGLSRSDAYALVMGVPPLAEQHRIVAKVDALMALCDQLEAARVSREAERDKLTAASLVRLIAPDPDTFPTDARFALDNLAPLTTRADQIKHLRQTILNLAVRGELVEQDPSDEPSISLIEEIERLIADGRKRAKRLGSNGEPSGTECPAGWHMTSLSRLATFENGDRSSNYPSGSDIKSEGIPFISTKAIKNHMVSLDAVDFVSPEKFASLRSGKTRHLDILITLRGSVGKFGLFRETDQHQTGFINAQLLILRCLKVELVPFVMAYMRSDGFAQQISNLSSGSATPQLSAGQLASVKIPLPPLAEQHRIIAKVDELMALCDQLEASLTTGEQTRSRLFESVLHHALEPA